MLRKKFIKKSPLFIFFEKGGQVKEFFKWNKSGRINLVRIFRTNGLTVLANQIRELYSYRKASMGLSLPAFIAGYKPAANPTKVQIKMP